MRPCVIKNIYLLKTILHLSGGSQQRQTNSSEFQCVFFLLSIAEGPSQTRCSAGDSKVTVTN